jgi:chromate reductase
LPLFNPDDDDGAPPAIVASLREMVRSSDGLIFAAPEYAHGVPGAFKNALDWLVSSDAFPGKPVMLVNTAPRAFHAQASLRETLATMSARLIPDAFVALPLTGEKVEAKEIAANARFTAALRAGLDAFVEAIRGDAA